MPAPVGFIPDNAPEGFTLDEPTPSVSKQDALKLGVGFSSEVPSMLTRLLQSGAEGSEMGRQQGQANRAADPLGLGFTGLGPARADVPGAFPELGATLSAIPGLLGKFVAGAGRTLRDVVSPSTYLPMAEQPRPFIISPEGIGKMTPDQAALREPLTAGRPLVQLPRTQLDPEGTDFQKQFESLTTPESIGMIAAGEVAPKVGLGLLATMVPGIVDDVKAVVDSDVSPQEKRDRINGLIVPAVLGLNSMRSRGEIPSIEKVTPDATKEGKVEQSRQPEYPGTPPQRLPAETVSSDRPVGETPIQAKAPDVVKPPEPQPSPPAVAQQPPEAPASSAVPTLDLKSASEASPSDFYKQGKAVTETAMAGKGPSLQVTAENAFRANPDVAAWEKAYADAQKGASEAMANMSKAVEDAKAKGESPEQAMIDGQETMMGAAQKSQFFAEGLKIAKAESKPAAAEKIASAAVRAEGQVHTGANHPEILDKLGIKGFETSESRNTSDFGFVTDKGRFISREEAGPIAKASGQDLKAFEPGEPVHSNEVESPTEPGKPLSETGNVPRGTITPSETPPQAVAKAQAEVSKVAAVEGQRPAKEVKKELLGRIDDELKKGESPNATVSIDIPGDGSFKVPNTKEALIDFRAKVKALPVNPEGFGKLPVPKAYLSEEAIKLTDSYGSAEAAWQSAKRQREALPDNDPETPQKVEKVDALLDELYSKTKAGISEAKAEQARDAAQNYRVGGESFREAIAKIQSLNKKTPKRLEELADLQKRYTENQKRLGEYEKTATDLENVAAKEKSALEAGAAQTPPPVEADSDTAEIGVGDETGVEMSRHGTASGLPPSVPDRGPGFAAELLEASRQLGTLVRSRVTLAKGVAGQYVRARASIGQNDRIEVVDIHNQLTVAHEMGHDIDALIWPKTNLARSQRSLEERVPGTSGKDLQKELIPISELMRGPITGTKGHQAYRKSAVELIADFFSLYAHDPETARNMAPKFSEGFEKQLSTNPDSAGVINQLLEGNVEPVPAEQTSSGPAAAPTETPGKVRSRLFADPVARDAPAAVAAQDLVKGTVREFESRVQRARVTADKWREQVPNKADRSDVGAFVEGIGNIELPGDTIDGVKDRMSPVMRMLAKTYRFEIEAQRNEINAYLKDSEQGEYLKFLEDYLPHFYANSTAGPVRSALTRFVKDSPNAKARKLPTVREAIDLGLIPITQDPAVLYEHHANINWCVATNRQLMYTLKDMKLSTGEPAVVPAKDAPPGWEITQNPLVQKVYARQTPNGVMIWKGGAAIHPDVWNAVRQILEQPVSSDLGKAYDSVNALTRANAFAFSMFHDLTLRSAAGGEMMGANPFRGLLRLFERNPQTGQLEAFRSTRGLGKDLLKDEEAVADAAKHGLKFAWTDSESYQHNARDFLDKAAAKWRDVPYLGKTVALARDIQHMRQEGLWKNTHDAFKIVAYNDAVSKALADAPKGTNVNQVKEQIASRLNDAFGGQEWQTKFWLSPQVRHAMSRFFLAPDWTLSTLRSVPGVSDAASIIRTQTPRLVGREPGVANMEGVAGNLGRGKFWAGELAALAGATLATQYAIYSAFGNDRKGDKPWVWDNESGQRTRIDITPLMRMLPWHNEKDPTRYYVNLGKRPQEVLAWIIHPEVNVMAKMARPVAEVFHQITGMEGDFKEPWKQDHETFAESIPQRAKSVEKEAIPFVFSGNQFALSVPFRKVMTKSKAQNAYKSVYELATDPNRLRSFLRGQQPSEGSLQSMVSEITDAATRK